jgi:DNA modification methylase
MVKYCCETCIKNFRLKETYDKHMNKEHSYLSTQDINDIIRTENTEINDIDFSNKTKLELIAICKNRGLKGYSSKNKLELIELLSHTKTNNETYDNILKIDQNTTENKEINEMDFSKKTRSELIAICKNRGLKGYSSKNKLELIELLSSVKEKPTDNKVSSSKEDDGDIQKNSFCIGDNLELLKKVKNETVHMIYLDPPYNTGRNFHYFKDKFADFPKFMEERIQECHRVLKKDGNIIIHVEPRISHHIRIICDKIFGDTNFKNEIVWHSGGNAKNKYQLGRNHDTIIVYGKSSNSKFYPLYKPYTDEYKKNLKMCPYHKKLYSTSAAHNSQPEVNPRPNLIYEWNGNIRQWYFSNDKIKLLHDDNRLEYNTAGIPRIKRFLDEMEGIPVRDTWDDISSIQNGEKTKYATQKPIKLLERILALYSCEGDLCMDPFAGSGTLGRACKLMKREYILFDINPEAKMVYDTDA